MSFGYRIVSLRKEKNITRNEFCGLIGLSYSSVSKYESDERFPTHHVLIKIADFYNVSLDYLLCRTNIRNSFDSNIVSLNRLNEYDVNLIKAMIERLGLIES